MVQRSWRCWFARKTLICVALVGLAADVDAATFYVDASLATGANDGSSWANAFQGSLGLHAALAVAGSGDEVWVAAGVYKAAPPAGDRSLSFDIPSGTRVYGGFASGAVSLDERDPVANLTILSGDLNDDDGPVSDIGLAPNRIDNTLHVVELTDCDESTILDGFEIRSGVARTIPGSTNWDRSGGCVRVSGGAPQLRNLVARWGRSDNGGGGMAVMGAAPTFENCQFVECRGDNWGSGLAVYEESDVSLVGCEFNGNFVAIGSAFFGRLLFNSPDLPNVNANISKCVFRDSVCVISSSSGGGIFSRDCNVVVTESRFENNQCVGGGGGCYLADGTAWIDRCDFINNSAVGDGGGAIYFDSMIQGNDPNFLPRLTNSRFVGNDGAVLCFANTEIVGCTFANNSLSDFGFWPTVMNGTGTNVLFANSVVHGNGTGTFFPGQGSFVVGLGTYDIKNCIIESWDGSNGGDAQDVDPQFVDLDGPDDIRGTADDDLRLAPTSPAIDAGSNGLLLVDEHLDFAGAARIADGDSSGTSIVDMGAYEFHGNGICGDFDDDGDVDLSDLTNFVDCLGGPESPAGVSCQSGILADCDDDNDVDLSDFALFTAAFSGEL